MTYSFEAELTRLDEVELVTARTMGLIRDGGENLGGRVDALLREFDVGISADDIINAALQALKNPRCCSDG